MKICFMGTPSFASKPLNKLLENNYNIQTVYTRLPKPKGRKKELHYSDVHLLAKKYNINVETPKTFKNGNNVEEFLKHNYDLCIVASYGLILPEAILKSPKFGCVNLHASILPKYRGASPIQMALKNGDSETGITVMKMDQGLDTGDIGAIHKLDIAEEDTFTTLFEKLGDLAADIIIPTIENIRNNIIKYNKQNSDSATIARLLSKKDGIIDFESTASEIIRQIRAYEIFPGSYFMYNNTIFKIIKAASINANHNYKNGTIISNNPLHIACKNSILEVKIIQRQGKKSMSIDEFCKGYSFPINTQLLASNVIYN